MIYQTTLNMKKILITFLSMIMFLNATDAFAWGAKGHDIVAAIAEQHLTRKAKKNIVWLSISVNLLSKDIIRVKVVVKGRH